MATAASQSLCRISNYSRKDLRKTLQKAKKEQQLLVILTAAKAWNEKLVNYLTDKYSKDWEEDDDSEETPQIALPYVYYVASRQRP